MNDLGIIPLIILTSSRPVTADGSWEQDPQIRRLELQQELTSLSENSEIRLFDDLGHFDLSIISECTIRGQPQ